MSKTYISCQVLLGLFENEYYVLVNGTNSYYIHRDNVKLEGGAKPEVDTPVKGRVVAYVVDQQGDKTLVQLPGEPVVGSLRTWVDKAAFA